MQCLVESCKSLQSSASLAIYLRSDMLRNQDEGSRRSLPAVDTGSIFCCNAASRDFCLPPPLWRPNYRITVLYGPQTRDDSYTASLSAIGTILRSRKSRQIARGSSYMICGLWFRCNRRDRILRSNCTYSAWRTAVVAVQCVPRAHQPWYVPWERA